MRGATALLTALSLTLLLLITSCVGGADHFVKGDLLVMVYSTDHEPIANGAIRHGKRVLGRTDSFGRLVIPELSAGEKRFLASARGYAPQELSFSFQSGTQILYVSLEPLGPVCAEAFLEGDRVRLTELLSLLEEANGSKEELSLVRALLLAGEKEEAWRDEVKTLAPEIGRRRTDALIRALEVPPR
jgi:hypothetical protein